MMELIPTYEVIVDPEEGETGRRVYRVPEDRLSAFLSVLVFNNVRDFRVIREDTYAQ